MKTAEKQIEQCKQCHTKLVGPFCSNCGASQQLQRINKQYILSEVTSVLNFDKGILFTIKELLLRPGVNVQKFILENRNRLVKPIVFIIVCSLIYTVSQRLFQFEDGYVNYSFGESTAITAIFDWITQNYGYTNILMAVFISFWIKLFFRKYGYNFYEILILLCFLIGNSMLIFSFFGMLDSLTAWPIADKGFLVGILYIFWGIARFFDKKKKINYLKSALSYILGLMSFTMLAMLLGLFIDWMSK